MIRPETGEDITDEKFIKVLKPFVDNYDEYLECHILPIHSLFPFFTNKKTYLSICLKIILFLILN